MQEPEVMNADEVAQFLRVSKATLYKSLRQEELPARRIGREWRILRSELLSWLRGYSPDEWARDWDQTVGEIRQEADDVSPEAIEQVIQVVRAEHADCD